MNRQEILVVIVATPRAGNSIIFKIINVWQHTLPDINVYILEYIIILHIERGRHTCKHTLKIIKAVTKKRKTRMYTYIYILKII